MKAVLFVCMANICRSPALEATLRHLAVQRGLVLHVDSCGVGWHHVGQHPDPRTFAAAKKRNILIDHRAQQFQDHFFDEFDLLLAVERDLVEQLKFRARSEAEKKKILLATAYSKKYKDQDIPDPYYLSPSGFDDVMEIIIDSCEGLLDHLVKRS